jgi:hypothetical protein
MRTFNMRQRSPEWYAIRTGVVTASDFGKAIDILKSGKPSAERLRLLDDKVTERITHDLTRHFTNDAMKRGQDLEADAITAYESFTGHLTNTVGFVMHDTLKIGCSPDALCGAGGMAEVKCPASGTEMVKAWLDMPSFLEAYEPQIRGQMWLCERDWCDLVVYHPKFPLLVHRVFEDSVKTKDLADKVIAFEAEVTEKYVAMLHKFSEHKK